MAKPHQLNFDQRLAAVLAARGKTFLELVQLGGLGPRQLRFQNWSDASFAGEDLRGTDFTGGCFTGCDFTEARIAGARFDQAILGELSRRPEMAADISTASDWIECCEQWTAPKEPAGDRHINPGAIFQDAPFAPKLVMMPQSVHPSWYDENLALEPQDRAVSIPYSLAVAELPLTTVQLSMFHHLKSRAGLAETQGTGTMGNRSTVAEVSWALGLEYVAWLSLVTGREYRLLSECEWLYAWQYGVFRDVAPSERLNEWCEDHYGDDPANIGQDGMPWLGGSEDYRVVRGVQSARRVERRRGSLVTKTNALRVSREVFLPQPLVVESRS